MKTMKSKDEVGKKQSIMTMKFTMKKFHLVSNYANYCSWDEKQNTPKKNVKKILQKSATSRNSL